MEQREDMRGVWPSGLAFAPALVWILLVPCFPNELSRSFCGSNAALFIATLIAGSALTAIALSLKPRVASQRLNYEVWAAFLLPLGVAPVAFLPDPGAVLQGVSCILAGLSAGIGLTSSLVCWAPAFSQQSTRWTAKVLAVALGAVALLFTIPLWLLRDPVWFWRCLWFLALAAPIAAIAAKRMACAQSQTSPHELLADSTKVPESIQADFDPASLIKRPGFWEPLLGLGLSLMSALLPWGSFLLSVETSLPFAWTFAIGVALAGCLLAVLGLSNLLNRFPFDRSIFVVMPLLAAAVVGLRLLGDIEEIGYAGTVFKGIASGAVGSLFFAVAWLSMSQSAQGSRDMRTVFSCGLAISFTVSSLILPIHAISQHAAALVAPILSLTFLVATSCSSFIQLGRPPQEDGTPEQGKITVEEAVAAIACENGLSPRETEVLGYLASGRSAEGIAEILTISPHTVRAHVRNIHEKLQISSRDQLVDLIDEARTASDSK